MDRDLAKGKSTSGAYTVNTTSAVAVPGWAEGVKIYAFVNNIRFAFGESPAAIGADAQAVGGFALAGVLEARVFKKGAQTTLNLLSTASTVVWVEFFGG